MTMGWPGGGEGKARVGDLRLRSVGTGSALPQTGRLICCLISFLYLFLTLLFSFPLHSQSLFMKDFKFPSLEGGCFEAKDKLLKL